MPPESVFVDTNVLLSGLMFRGNEARVLELAVRGRVRLVVSQLVLREARDVLQAKFSNHVRVLDAYLDLVEYELVEDPTPEFMSRASSLLRDPGDAPILAAILDSKPDRALTGDKDLLTDAVRAVAPMQTCAEYLGARRPPATE